MEKGKNYLHIPISDKEKQEILNFILKRQGSFKKGDYTKWTLIAWHALMTSDYMNTHTHSSTHKNEKHQDKVRIETKELMQGVTRYLQQEQIMEIQKGKLIPATVLIGAICTLENIKDKRAYMPRINRLVYHRFIDQVTQYQAATKNAGSYRILDTGFEEEKHEEDQNQDKNTNVQEVVAK